MTEEGYNLLNPQAEVGLITVMTQSTTGAWSQRSELKPSWEKSKLKAAVRCYNASYAVYRNC